MSGEDKTRTTKISLPDTLPEMPKFEPNIRRAPDRVTDFGAGRFVSDTTVVDVRVADLPVPRPGDVIVIGADSHVIQGEPLRDRERLIWTLDLRSA